MTVLDSSFLSPAPGPPGVNPLDMVMESLRAQIVGEVKSEIAVEVIDRVIRIVGSTLSELQINQSVTLSPNINVPPATVNIDVPAPLVDVEFDLSDLATQLDRNNTLLDKLLVLLSKPVQRDVIRNSDNLIQSVTERRL